MVLNSMFLHVRGKHDAAPPWIILFKLNGPVDVLRSEDARGSEEVNSQTLRV